MTNASKQTDIVGALKALQERLAQRLGFHPGFEPELRIYASGGCGILIWNPEKGYSEEIARHSVDGIDDVIEAAKAYIDALPDFEAIQRQRWNNDLNRFVEMGDALMLPETVMSPLKDASQAMSDTFQSVARTHQTMGGVQ